jgi:hypothetical protein
LEFRLQQIIRPAYQTFAKASKCKVHQFTAVKIQKQVIHTLTALDTLIKNRVNLRLRTFRVLGVSFDLILLGVFLAFSSLGAGLNERTRTPLGAHQQRFRSQ